MKDNNPLTEKILRKRNINFTVDSQGFYNVDGDCNIDRLNITSFGKVQFGSITGNFVCSNNNIFSLKGCPKEVGGYFFCYNNKLSSLEYGPLVVGKDYSCYGNNIKLLDHIPKVKGTGYYIHCDSESISSYPNIKYIGIDTDSKPYVIEIVKDEDYKFLLRSIKQYRYYEYLKDFYMFCSRKITGLQPVIWMALYKPFQKLVLIKKRI